MHALQQATSARCGLAAPLAVGASLNHNADENLTSHNNRTESCSSFSKHLTDALHYYWSNVISY